jgi:hypothetical protein
MQHCTQSNPNLKKESKRIKTLINLKDFFAHLAAVSATAGCTYLHQDNNAVKMKWRK